MLSFELKEYLKSCEWLCIRTHLEDTIQYLGTLPPEIGGPVLSKTVSVRQTGYIGEIMQIRIFLPNEILIDQPVSKVTAEAEHGSFCLLPHHIDYLAILIPGVVTLVSEQGDETFVAVDEGILVKCGSEVRISTRNAVQGTELNSLKQQVEQQFRSIDEQERLTRSALAQLEASLARYFTTL